jgi:hypothetical protein
VSIKEVGVAHLLHRVEHSIYTFLPLMLPNLSGSGMTRESDVGHVTVARDGNDENGMDDIPYLRYLYTTINGIIDSFSYISPFY